MLLSWLYVAFGTTTVLTALFTGLAAAVLAIVVQAVVRVGRRALAHPALVLVAVAAFLALAVFRTPFPIIIALAGMIGWLLGRYRPHVLRPARHGQTADGPAPVIADDALHSEVPNLRRSLRVLAVGLLAWAMPMVAVFAFAGTDSVYAKEGLFFSGAALITFGGAYAVLAYVAQQAVATYHWLTSSEMVRGLALAETTPGPLIMVVQFVAFVGAYRDPGSLNPWLAAVIGALLTTWVTFVPCFVFIFLGAPYVEKLRGNKSISAILSGITAAVVGVIANLAYYFGLHTTFRDVSSTDAGPVRVEYPHLTTIHWEVLGVAIAAAIMIFKLKWSVLRVLGICAVLGLATAAWK
jgi:chromate transporter